VNDPIKSLSKTAGQYGAGPQKIISKDGNKTVYFDTIKTSSKHPNLQSSLTYWRLKKYKSGGSVRTVRGELQTDMTSSEVD
jgi:hypothetical protein